MMEVNYTILVNMVKVIIKSPLLLLLIILIGMDIVTGTAKAIHLKQLNSKISKIGMIKHFTVVATVFCMGVFSMIFDVRPISIIFCGYYIFSYALSMLENYEALGWPFPSSLKPFFEQMRKNAEENIVKVDKLEVKQVEGGKNNE